jgi:hypothetical protein
MSAASPVMRAIDNLYRYVFLVGPTHHNAQHVVRQRPLQRLGFVPRPSKPCLALLVGRQDHRHRLRMDRLNDGVRRRRQEAVDLMWPGYRLRLSAAIAVECRPDARERRERAIVAERESNNVFLLRFWVRLRRVLGEAVERCEATVLSLEPPAHVRR